MGLTGVTPLRPQRGGGGLELSRRKGEEEASTLGTTPLRQLPLDTPPMYPPHLACRASVLAVVDPRSGCGADPVLMESTSYAREGRPLRCT
eukprot:scaffold8799_cov89-Isochrysis_galbana.AAC.1